MMKPPLDAFNAWDIGRVSVHNLLIKLGVRSAAEITVHNEYAEEIRQEIEEEGLLFRAGPWGEHHTEFMIFREPHVGDIIERIEAAEDGALRAWCWGKLFGYSEADVGEYLAREHGESL